jgi:hypothetical protein
VRNLIKEITERLREEHLDTSVGLRFVLMIIIYLSRNLAYVCVY